MNYPELILKLIKSKMNLQMPAAKMKKYQQKRLREMLIYAYGHSSYYHAAFRAVGINAKNIESTPIKRFPTLNKKTLLDKFDSIITVNDISQYEMRQFDTDENKDKKTIKGYHIVHSSGSTGNPGYFLYDENAWNEMLIGIIRAALWDLSLLQIFKFVKSKPKILFIAAADGRYGGATAVGDGLDNLGFPTLVLDVQMPIDEWKKRLEKFRPDVIIGYPTAIKILSQISGMKFRLKRLITCGEPLPTSMCRLFRKRFKCQIINFYGASESIVIGVETNQSGGMYLFDDMNYVEINPDGIYLTCLYNFAQPLIRYKISDKAECMKPDGQYPFSKIRNILGRSEDVMWFKNSQGKAEFLHPLSIEGLCLNGLIDYQFVQLSDNSFEIHAQFSNEADTHKIKIALNKDVRKILRLNGLDNVSFKVISTDEIKPDKNTGKKPLIRRLI